MSDEASAFIVTFESSHSAVRAERELKKTVKEIDLIPVPREISSACGFCLLIPVLPHGGDAMIETLEERVGSYKESLWALFETAVPGIRRKEKRYERIS